MRVIESRGGVRESNAELILRMYAAVARGVESEARGQKTRNVRNLAIVMNAEEPPITSFEDRKLNLAYAKKEWLWYLGADRFDSSIEEHATMWKKLKQPDGSYFSNYGHYIFGPSPIEGGAPQFHYCYRQLCNDRGSRRASIVLLKQEHLFEENIDTVCTYSINFTIEQNQLHMTVMMRSNDVIFGFTNDAFCFQQLYSFMYAMLKTKIPSLRAGQYVHMSNSMHVYERHFEMIEKIVMAGMRKFKPVVVPPVTAEEVISLIQSRGKSGSGSYCQWLLGSAT